MSALELSADRARIFRITHIQNLPWIIQNGLCCRNWPAQDPNFVQIGNRELIGKRADWRVPIDPGGVLADYVPFYFTPHSMMLYNIHTGYNGIRQVANKDIVLIVSSIHQLEAAERSFVFSDRHALLKTAQFYNSSDDLHRIDWELLQARDFRHDPENPEKTDLYQAEALVHRRLAVDDITGIVCYTENEKRTIMRTLEESGSEIPVAARPKWYF